jgi:hypothetical protein
VLYEGQKWGGHEECRSLRGHFVLLIVCLPHLFLVKMGGWLPFGYRGQRREQEGEVVRGKGRSDKNRGWGEAGVYLFVLFSGGNKVQKIAKNRRGREEERGE